MRRVLGLVPGLVLLLATAASGQWFDAGGYWINAETLEIRGEGPMGAYDDYMVTGDGLGSGVEFHIPVVSDIIDDMGNVTASNEGTFTLGGASTITGIGGRTGADSDAATTLNGTSQGLTISDAFAATIIETGGWLSGWFRTDTEQTDAPMLMSITNSLVDTTGLWVFVTNDAGFGADYRTVEFFLRNSGNTQVVNGTGVQFAAESPLGAFIVVGHEQVSGSTWRFKFWVNGNPDREFEYTKSGTLTGCDTISFGMLRRFGGDSNFLDGDFQKVSGGTGMPTDAQVRAAYNAARGLTDSDYVSVSPGGIVESTSFDATEATIIPINLTAAARVVPVFVYPDSGGTNSGGAFTTFSPTKASTLVRALSSGNDSEMYGQEFTGRTHMGWAHDDGSYELDAGYHVLHFHTYSRTGTFGTTAKVFANFSFGSTLPVDGTGNSYSTPTNCVYDGDDYWIGSGEVGSDDRYIYKKTAEGVVTARKLADGLRVNDINHAGGFVLPLSGGVLAAWVGHNDPQIRCEYFASGDISTGGTTFTIGIANSNYSYPQAQVISGDDVGVLLRGSTGTAGDRTAEHSAVFIRFDGTDGTVTDTTVIYDTDDGDTSGKRCYANRWGVQTVSGSDYYWFEHNFRDWSDDRSESILFVFWNATADTWHLVNNDEINVTNTGHAQGTGAQDSPIVPTAIIGQKVTAAAGSRGPLLVSDSDYSVDTLHVPGADAALADFSDGPSAVKFMTLFTAADQPAVGGHQTTKWYSLVWNGGLEINEFEPFGGDANTTFVAAAMAWKDGTIGGTARILIANSTAIYETGIDGEPSGPYYENRWQGGNKLALYETAAPFADAPFAGLSPIKKWNAPFHRNACNLSVVAGSPNAFAFEMEVHQNAGHSTKSQTARHLLTDDGDTRLVDGETGTLIKADASRRSRSRLRIAK